MFFFEKEKNDRYFDSDIPGGFNFLHKFVDFLKELKNKNTIILV